MNASTIFAVLSFVTNLILALVIYSFRVSIKLAINEAVGGIKDNLAENYATKRELLASETRLEEKIALRNTVLAAIDRRRYTRDGPNDES